jgi:dTDP-glucose 4,6-dehydratase
MKRFLITGGAGFIGSTVIRFLVKDTDHQVLNLGNLTYAGNLDTLIDVDSSDRHHFAQADICDAAAVRKTLFDFKGTSEKLS